MQTDANLTLKKGSFADKLESRCGLKEKNSPPKEGKTRWGTHLPGRSLPGRERQSLGGPITHDTDPASGTPNRLVCSWEEMKPARGLLTGPTFL